MQPSCVDNSKTAVTVTGKLALTGKMFLLLREDSRVL